MEKKPHLTTGDIFFTLTFPISIDQACVTPNMFQSTDGKRSKARQEAMESLPLASKLEERESTVVIRDQSATQNCCPAKMW